MNINTFIENKTSSSEDNFQDDIMGYSTAIAEINGIDLNIVDSLFILPKIKNETETAVISELITYSAYKNNKREVFRRIIEQREEERKQKVDEIVQKLVSYLKFYNYDEESSEIIWVEIDKINSSTPLPILGSALLSIVIKYYDTVNILCGIAKCLCSYDLEETDEWGIAILANLISHKSETVKEYAVLLIDNWKNPKLLPFLKNIDPKLFTA